MTYLLSAIRINTGAIAPISPTSAECGHESAAEGEFFPQRRVVRAATPVNNVVVQLNNDDGTQLCL
jgi:hypothetical protein